jgi:hypothetical protein
LRASWARDLIAQAVHLDRHGGTPYPQALDLPLSFLRSYFESEVYQQDAKAQEARQKLDVAVVGRLDVVIKALGALGKALVRR